MLPLPCLCCQASSRPFVYSPLLSSLLLPDKGLRSSPGSEVTQSSGGSAWAGGLSDINVNLTNARQCPQGEGSVQSRTQTQKTNHCTWGAETPEDGMDGIWVCKCKVLRVDNMSNGEDTLEHEGTGVQASEQSVARRGPPLGPSLGLPPFV